MPRKPRKLKKRLLGEGVTKPQLAHLCIGHCLSTVVKWHDKLNFPFKDEQHRKKLWLENREYILSLRDHIDFYIGYKSGSRPAAWWDFESKEPRKSVSESGKFETQFQYLKRLNLLLPDEELAYHERKKAEKAKAARLEVYEKAEIQQKVGNSLDFLRKTRLNYQISTSENV